MTMKFKKGDRVEAGERGTDEHDTGTVIDVRGDEVRVHWEVADEAFWDMAANVRPLKGKR